MMKRCPKCQAMVKIKTTPNKKKSHIIRTKFSRHQRLNRGSGQMKRCEGSLKTVNGIPQ